MNLRLLPLFAAFALGMANPAFAGADLEFDFSDIYADHGFGQRTGSGGSTKYYLDGDETGTGMGVSITGWQARTTNSNFVNRTGNLKNFSNVGFGLDYGERWAEEGFDNRGRYDLVIFEFDEMVSLDSINLGWVGSDADLTVLAHTGTSDPTLRNNRFRYNENSGKGMTNLGWELVGHYAENTGQDVNIGASVMSSFWAIGAYTSAITDAARTYGTPDSRSDYFTLRRLAVATAGAAVSEPSVLALMIVGVLLLSRRMATR